MRLAELARVRWVLAAASIAFVGSAAAVIATRPCHSKAAVVQRHDLPVIGGCHQRAKKVAQAPTPAPKHQISGEDYRDALLAIQPAFSSCLKKGSSDVTYRLSVDIKADGSVASVDVRSEAVDMRKVSLKTTQCLERAITTATFPAAGAEKRVSTVLQPDKL